MRLTKETILQKEIEYIERVIDGLYLSIQEKEKEILKLKGLL